MSDVEPLLEVLRRLRDPSSGCPWDLEQDFASIAPHTIEEAYEVADVIERRAWDELPDELGDLLFQIAFYSQMAEERDWFSFSDIIKAIVDKMIRRHPHVFADAKVTSAEAQTVAWEALKRTEAGRSDKDSLMDSVPRGLAVLKRAHKLQRRAAQVGFDWPNAAAVLPKVHEELQELEQAVEAQAGTELVVEELGDLLFTCVNLARHLDIDADSALRHANLKFDARFRAMELLAVEAGVRLEDCSAEELERFWQQVKQND